MAGGFCSARLTRGGSFGIRLEVSLWLVEEDDEQCLDMPT